ncbi:MAG: NAD(P)-dependent oxidoreductase [Bryobacteraceae bacterium]
MATGLIGVGLLGSAIAERLAAAGFALVSFDADPAKRVGTKAASAADVARSCDRLILCLPDSRISAQVLGEIAPALAPGAIVIDTTTGEPSEMESFGRRGFRYVDATVAGSSEQVRAGEAIVMAGGAPADVGACSDVLHAFAARVFHTGGCGSAARMKLVVNLVLGLNRAALAEGLAFAEACGVDPAAALEVLRAGPAYSKAMDTKGAKMLTRDFAPQARLRQHHKDVRLILAEGGRLGARLPLSAVHDELLREAEEMGLGDADNSAVIEVMRR